MTAPDIHWVVRGVTDLGFVRHVSYFVCALRPGTVPLGGLDGSEWGPVGGPFADPSEAVGLLRLVELAREVVES